MIMVVYASNNSTCNICSINVTKFNFKKKNESKTLITPSTLMNIWFICATKYWIFIVFVFGFIVEFCIDSIVVGFILFVKYASKELGRILFIIRSLLFFVQFCCVLCIDGELLLFSNLWLVLFFKQTHKHIKKQVIFITSKNWYIIQITMDSQTKMLDHNVNQQKNVNIKQQQQK